MTAASSPQLRLVVAARNDQYNPDDERWLAQAATLHHDLLGAASAGLETAVTSQPVEGTKGGLDELVVSLGSAGAFTALVECVRAWLGRDRDRRIEIRWDDQGAEHHVTFTGTAVDNDAIQVVARAAAARIGGTPWPADTAPS
jgi:hypothetical protein